MEGCVVHVIYFYYVLLLFLDIAGHQNWFFVR